MVSNLSAVQNEIQVMLLLPIRIPCAVWNSDRTCISNVQELALLKQVYEQVMQELAGPASKRDLIRKITAYYKLERRALHMLSGMLAGSTPTATERDVEVGLQNIGITVQCVETRPASI